MTVAGIRHRYTSASEREIFLRHAILTLGGELACRAYPDAAALDALDLAYSIGGSLAGSFAGEPRSTLDIDIVVALETTQVPALVRALENDFYIDSDALHRAVTERGTTSALAQNR